MTMRTAAIEFVAAQNVTDRQELLFRAHRHASERTGQLPVPVAQRVVQAFVAAVNREVLAESPLSRVLSTWIPYADSGGGDLDEFQRMHQHTSHEMRLLQQYLDHKGLPTASRRTASVVADFPDELMY